MQARTFNSLPAELRDAIWRLAIPSTTFHIKVQIKGPGWLGGQTQCSITATPDVKHRNNLLKVCRESSAVFKRVKKVRIFEPVGEIDGGMREKWKVVVNPINLDPSYDTIDFSAPGARVAKFAEVFPELASCINAAVILFHEIPSLWWTAARLPRVTTLTVVITGIEERTKLGDEIQNVDLQPQMQHLVDGVIQPQVSQETVIYSRMKNAVDSEDANVLDLCGILIKKLPSSMRPGS